MIFDLDKKNFLKIIYLKPLYFYIPLSIIRLLSINFIYLFLIKFLLLTTHYEQIIKILIINLKHITPNSFQKISFEIIIAAQFLKIIVKEIKILKMAYKIRNPKSQHKYLSKEQLLTYWLLIRQLVLNIYQQTFNIADTLYSREINHNHFIIDYL